ncbi:MAG: exo-alpha-sialidase [Propionibacteriales bacterium]|nr:exo-alpha-sialidase [Propionibacteriales bacterium]
MNRHFLRLVGAAAFAFAVVGITAPAGAEDADDTKHPFVTYKSPPNAASMYECTATGNPAADLNLDCDDPYPNNEPNVAVDPQNALHMVASSNDYGSCCDQYYTTFDGGHTWRTGNMSRRGPNVIGSDPITVFDPKHNTVVHLSLNYKVSSGIPAVNGSVVASVSTNGGLHWKVPSVVGKGLGAHLFFDKEDATVDTNRSSPYYGRIYVTWTGFFGDAKRYLSSPILMASSDDGGHTWSEPKEISGFNSTYCTYQEDGPANECDEDQGSAPRVGPDGTVYVTFQNGQNTKSWEQGERFEDQYMIVKSTNGGRTFSSPRHMVNLEDGSRDYPTNVDGRQTLTGLQLRVPTFGTLSVNPISGRLYQTFSDNQAGVHDVNNPVTQSEAYIITSKDGKNWSDRTMVDPDGQESWFPWVDVAPDGTVGVIYNDRRRNDTYVAELAEGSPGSGFATQVVSQARSHPNDSRYFDALIDECPYCSTFHGDYLGLDYGSDNKANMVWTDMRDKVSEPVADRGQYLQFVYFARR